MTRFSHLTMFAIVIASLCACQAHSELDASSIADSGQRSQGLPQSTPVKAAQTSLASPQNVKGNGQLGDFAQIWSGSASSPAQSSTKQENQRDLRDSHEFKRLQTYIAAANYSAAMRYASTAAMKDLIQLEIYAHQEMLQVEAVTAKADQEPKHIKEL